MKAIIENLRPHLHNFKGWRTDRKIIVFESDDWGSVRMPSVRVYQKLLEAGIPVDRSIYCRYDSLETNQDLEKLFDVLLSFKDCHGNAPVITANTVVGNPDFQRIRESGFQDYFFEPFTETLNRYSSSDRVFSYFKKGIEEKIFIPQFHGREHVNVPFWFQLLKDDKSFQLAFSLQLWGLSRDVFPHLKRSIQATYDCNLDFAAKSIEQGLQLFDHLFGFKSQSFIANNFIWSPALNSTLNAMDVKFFQGMKYQLLPMEGENKKRKKIWHYSGEKNHLEQHFSIRNCHFELSEGTSSVESCLSDISNAFFWKKPAIISVHRLNFSGRLDGKNRNANLRQFRTLLKAILKRWPDTAFLSTPDLFRSMIKETST